jgi:hypothetical protein
MRKTLQYYNDFPVLDTTQRDKMNERLLNLMMNNMDLLEADIREILEYFITDLGNSDFIRLVDNVNDKLIKG